MSMSYVRHAVLLRSLKYQFSCLSVRGVHQHTLERPTCFESSIHDRSSLLYHTRIKEANDKSLQGSLQKKLFSEINKKYRCLGGVNINNIVDEVKPNLKYECPKVSDHQIEISIPAVIGTILPIDEPGSNQVEKVSPGTCSIEKLAKQTGRMRIRKLKMKRHRRKRRFARNWPIYRKEKFMARKKKEKYFARYLGKLRGYGENYDALEDIKANLEYAKLRGFHLDIFGDQTKNFGFADELKQKK